MLWLMDRPRTLGRRIVANGLWIDALLDKRNSIVLNTQWTGYHGHAGPWNSGRRRLDDHLVYLVTGGTCEGAAAGNAFRVDAGTLMWIPSRVPHEVQYDNLDHYVLRFRLTDGKNEIVPGHRVMLQPHALELYPILDQIRNEMLGPLSWTEQRMRGLFVLFFSGLFHLEESHEEGGRRLNPFQRNQLIDYVHAHVNKRIEPASLARHLGLSLDYFSRLFRNAFGATPRSWLVRERIRLASMRMMASTLSIKQVASEFGYQNVSLFSRQFKQVHGRGPRAFRKGR